MTQIQINGSETETLRVFHLDLPREAVERFTTQAGTGEWPLKYALGAQALKASFVDVIAIRDLGPMPLSQYLAEAHNASGAAFKADKPRLDALKGHVLALPAQAFERTSQVLTVATPVRHVGTYGETGPRRTGATLRSDSAKGQGGGGAPAPAGRGTSAVLRLIVIGVGIVALLVLALILR